MMKLTKFQGGEGKKGGQAGDEAKNAERFSLAPAEVLEMVVDGGTEKNPFTTA